MKSILTKILLLILLITMIYIPNTTYAMGNVISQGEDFLSSRNNTSPINEVSLKETSDYVYNILFTIAVVLAIAIGMIIGIQFVMGSVEEQAKVKETLVPYVIGVFVVFASFTIWKIVINVGDSVSPTPAGTGTTSTTTPSRPSTISNCPYCGTSLTSGQAEDLSRYGSTTCRKSSCAKTITSTSSGGGSTPASVTYTKDATGNLYCGGCGDILSTVEQRRGQCSQCNSYITGI